MRIRTHLHLLVGAALLPVLVYGAFVVATLWSEQGRVQGQAALSNVRALAVAVEAEIQATVRTLQLLAVDADFDTSPNSDFVARAVRRLKVEPAWVSVVVAKVTAEPVTIGRTVYDASAGFIDPELHRRVIASGLPGVSGFIRLPGTRAPVTQIAVPATRGNAVTHVLVANVEAAAWARFLSGYEIPPNATVTLLDAAGIIIARTLNNERWAGGPPSPGLVDQLRKSPREGTARNTGLEGVEFQSAHRRIGAGWTVATGVPVGSIEAALLKPTFGMAGVGALVTALAVIAALVIGRHISTPVARLAESARALGRGEDPPAPDAKGIDEVSQASAAFAEAAALLRERRDALTEVIALEREARSKAEGASRAKDEFLAMLGHELRNPLNAITAAVALIERVPPGGEHAKRSHDIVARQARHLTSLVEDLLDVARVTSGKIVLERRTVDLAEVVRRSMAALESAGRLAQHRVEVSVQPVHVSGDETRLEQIATNLLENAVKYTPAGRAIRVRVEGEDREAVLEVSDEGEGLAPDLLPRVFELFTQGERTLDRAQGGLGLGLTLVKSLVGLHEGRVSAHSEGVGRGARFIVRLPRAAAPERVAAQAAASASPGKSRRVLLVEDNADSAETLRTLLELRGHEVSVAGDGPAGVAAGIKAPPEIALIDIGLPGFDGFEVARRLRAGPGGDAIRLVALTGYGQPDDRKAASEAGFDAFLVKPVDLEALHGLFTSL